MRLDGIKSNNVNFGIRTQSRTNITSPLTKRVVDVVSLDNGKRVRISTNYYKNKPTDRLITAFDNIGKSISSKLKYYNKSGKAIHTPES